jgi:glutathione synthase/RimK-type ligase-like ATP-grasp enzyme
MKIAIHKSAWGFSQDWIKYCTQADIPYKIVDCYSTDIIKELADCDLLLWHHHHSHAKDVLFAKALLFSLQQSGKTVFPDFNTGWHFDDKVGQKYLLESVGAPVARSYVFYDRQQANAWARQTSFPKVFKLRGGAGSTNVRLVHSLNEAKSLIRKAFGSGFSPYNRWVDLKENIRRFKLGKSNIKNVLKSVRRIFVSTAFARTIGNQKGYVYFQDFIPGNTFDIRIVTIGQRAFGIKRLTRENDFRASGSGFILYDKIEIPEQCVSIAFKVSAKMNADVVAYDFVFDKDNQPFIVEINYGYAHQAYFKCPGYWDEKLEWHEATFNSADWIIESVIGRWKTARNKRVSV